MTCKEYYCPIVRSWRKRFVVWLRSKGYTYKEIGRIVGRVDDSSIPIRANQARKIFEENIDSKFFSGRKNMPNMPNLRTIRLRELRQERGMKC